MYALEPEPERNQRFLVFGVAALITTLVQAGVLIWASGIESTYIKSARKNISIRVLRQPIKPKNADVPVIEKASPTAKKMKRTLADSRNLTRNRARAPKPMPVDQRPPNPKPSVPLVVGLTLSSTVQGGSGPRIGVGNTLMGTVERTAGKPQKSSLINSAQDIDQDKLSSVFGDGNSKARTEAKLLRKVIPDYPIRARNEGIEGVIVLALTISPQGRVEDVRLIKGLGHGLDKSALIAAQKTVWSPATIGGRPIRSMRRYNVRFTLES